MSSSEQPSSLPTAMPVEREDVGEYVAHLQLHMALQARNLVPPMATQSTTSTQRQSLLQQTQADLEKMISRQAF